jgi:hypothetical protein
MTIFFLQPKDGDTSHQRWEATFLKEGCWVRAHSEGQARQKVQRATIQMLDVRHGEKILNSPWVDGSLTDCVIDETPGLYVPEGVIVTVSGKTIS